MENWQEDTCVICRTNDTDFLQDACEECTTIWNNWADDNTFANTCLADGIDAYLHCK